MAVRSCLLASVLMAFGALNAHADTPASILELNAFGEIQISADGHVSEYRLESQLPAAVAALVDRSVRAWVFEPILIDGKAVVAKTALHVGLKAEPVAGKDDYLLRVTSVSFGAPKRLAGVKPPRYPKELVRAHTGGKVVLALRVDESGDVVEALPYQSGLDRDAFAQADAARYRRLLEEAAVDAARRWHFNPGEEINGKAIGTEVFMPIEFSVCAMPCARPSNGRWRQYFLGQTHPVPWLRGDGSGFDRQVAALGDGEPLTIDSHFRLRENVVGKTL